MKKRWIFSIALATLAVGRTVQVPAQPVPTQPVKTAKSFKTVKVATAADKTIVWKPSFQAALQEAKRTKKPIFVDFYTSFCGACKLVDKYVYTNPRIIKESKKWIFVKVNAEQDTILPQKYEVSEFPTLLLLKPTGVITTRIDGFHSPGTMLKLMQAAHAKSR